jgi:hypothetical protein
VISIQYLVLVPDRPSDYNETALHSSNEFELASLRASTRRAKAPERSRSAFTIEGAISRVQLYSNS